jgi:hypothetical protein
MKGHNETSVRQKKDIRSLRPLCIEYSVWAGLILKKIVALVIAFAHCTAALAEAVTANVAVTARDAALPVLPFKYPGK